MPGAVGTYRRRAGRVSGDCLAPSRHAGNLQQRPVLAVHQRSLLAQQGNASVGRFRHGALHIEMELRFAPAALFAYPTSRPQFKKTDGERKSAFVAHEAHLVSFSGGK